MAGETNAKWAELNKHHSVKIKIKKKTKKKKIKKKGSSPLHKPIQ